MSELYICNNAKDCKVKMGVGAPCHPHDHEGRFYGEWECGQTMKKVKCVKYELRGEQEVMCQGCGIEHKTSMYKPFDCNKDYVYVFSRCPECRHRLGTITLIPSNAKA